MIDAVLSKALLSPVYLRACGASTASPPLAAQTSPARRKVARNAVRKAAGPCAGAMTAAKTSVSKVAPPTIPIVRVSIARLPETPCCCRGKVRMTISI